MSPAELAALRRLLSILGGPRPDEVPAEALHAVALVKGWKVEKGLRDRWLLTGSGQETAEMGRALLVELLRVRWMPLAREVLRPETTGENLPTWVGPDGKPER